MKERIVLIIKLLVSHVFLVPIVLIVIFLFDLPLVPAIFIPQTILAVLFLAGYWEFFGTKTKWLMGVIYEMMIVLTFLAAIPSEDVHSRLSILLLSLIELYLLFQLGKVLWVIKKEDTEKIEIAFPFRNGRYLVTDGGNSEISRLMNYHFHSPVHKQKKTNRSMLFATDIVKLGGKVKKFLPPENRDYPIFGEDVYCPMAGRVIKIVNDIDDNLPFSGNYPYNTGNTVVIKNDNYYLLLGHLKKGSILVQEGSTVLKNTKIGKSGNSGMSERPHLHFQLMKYDEDNYWKGVGINMQFQGKNIYKNRLITI